MAAIERAALDAGAVAYVTKPFDPADLARVVAEVAADEPPAEPGEPPAQAEDLPPAAPAAGPGERDDRTAVDESVRRTEPNLAQVLSLAFDAIVSVDQSQRIVGFNKGAELTFGYQAEDVLGEPLDLLIPERLVDVHRHHLHAYGAEPGAGRLMGDQRYVHARRSDGSEFPAEASITKLEIDGQPVLTAILRDVTERHRDDAAREAFLHAVSHELRTPLTAVMGFSQLLTERHGTGLSAEALELANRIRSSASKLDRLLSDLLDLDRLGRGVLEAQRREVHVLDLVQHCLDTVNLEGRTLTVTVAPTDLRAQIDAAQVERIIENLVVNAVRHTPREASIEVRVRWSPDGLLVVVEDDGPGVPLDVRGQIFEPFRRDATPGTAGTGIGLSLVARFAELHGGRAWVEDRADGGASFQVLLGT